MHRLLCVACMLLSTGTAIAQETVTIPRAEYDALQENMRQGCIIRAAAQNIAQAALAEGVLPQTAIGFAYTTFNDELTYFSVEQAEEFQELATNEIPWQIANLMQPLAEGQEPDIMRELAECRRMLAFARQ